MHHSRPLTSWLAMCSTIGAAAALLATLPGCQKTEGPARPADSAAKTTPEIATDGAPDEKAGDIWEVFYLQDSKIGYGRTRIEPISRNGESLVEIDSLNHLAVLRFGQRAEQT